MLAAEIFPYSVWYVFAFSPTTATSLQVLQIQQQQTVVIRILKTSVNTAVCVLVQVQNATEHQWPNPLTQSSAADAPLRQIHPQKVTGHPTNLKSLNPSFCTRASNFGLDTPASAIPLRSPFTSGGKYRYADATEGLGQSPPAVTVFPVPGSSGDQVHVDSPSPATTPTLSHPTCNQQRLSHTLSLSTTLILLTPSIHAGPAKLYRLVRYLLQSLQIRTFRPKAFCSGETRR